MAVAATTPYQDSSLLSRCTYHVFLSFRGQDTRTNFTDHLHTALVQAGFHTFLDDEEIERGEDIMTELQRAIKESKIAIIVFSNDYASSTCCLNELVMILERRTVGLIVIPVFYDVDPSQVRKQTGSFAEAFARHEERFEKEISKVKMWRNALEQVSNLAGMALSTRHQSQFIQDVVTQIRKKLHRPVLHVAPHPIGIDSRSMNINLWLQNESKEVGMAAIYGMGGIGKTTIAKNVYNQNFEKFQGSSFLANVRETSNQPNGLVSLQNQLLSNILGKKINKVHNVDEGIIKIKKAICCRKVLIVLDDVDQSDQLDFIIGMREWLYPGSKIVVTTRDADLLRAHHVCVKFEVEKFDYYESLQLFSWHAFRKSDPIEGYVECSIKVVDRCGGLPLALKVLGSFFSGKRIELWERELQKLEEIPLRDIQDVLRISYESLGPDDKNLFLDIACFFVGKHKDYAVTILDGYGYYSDVGIDTLFDRCLLAIDKEKKIGMHDLIRDMGREIVRQESIDDPGQRSRLWRDQDAYTVLKDKTGTDKIKGLTLDLRRITEERDLEANSFKMMCRLKILQLKYLKVTKGIEAFSKHLVWLCWHGCPLKSIPTNFCLEKLVALDMRYSSLDFSRGRAMILAKLKILNLSHCHALVRTPNFSGLPCLERLIFKDCIKMVTVDESIGGLKKLVLLNLKDCKSLRKLPSNFSMLKSLEELNLLGCSELHELPEDFKKLESLKGLYLDGIPMNQILSNTQATERPSLLFPTFWPSTFWSWLSPGKSMHSVSSSIASLPHNLVRLSLANCNLSDDAVSSGISRLPSLQYLNLTGNPFHMLPKSINSLTMLQSLVLEDCPRLQSLPELPESLMFLRAVGCRSLERVTNLPNLLTSLKLEMIGCSSFIEAENMFKLESVGKKEMEMIKDLGLFDLESVGNVEVELQNYLALSGRKRPVQVFHEFGISSIFVPGSEIPCWYDVREMGSSVSVIVPALVGQKISGLNLCIAFASNQLQSALCLVKIHNKTKGLKWTYIPIFFPYSTVFREERMLWLSHWKFGDWLEGGDAVDVAVDMAAAWYDVKMCGIYLVYEPEGKRSQSSSEEQSTSPWDQILTLSNMNLSAYRIGRDKYFLCQDLLKIRSILSDDRVFDLNYRYQSSFRGSFDATV